MLSEHKPTIISISGGDRKNTTELPWDAGIDEIFDAIIGQLQILTWDKDTIINYMREYIEEHTDNPQLELEFENN